MKHNPTLTQWLQALTSSVEESTFIKAVLTLPTPAADDLKSIDIRPILAKRVLKLSFTFHHKTKDIVKNYTPAESTSILAKLLNTTFTSGRIFTPKNDILLTKKSGDFTLTRHGATSQEVPSLAHDKPKNHPLNSEGKTYLHLLGLTDAAGHVLKSAQDKFRQINKYIEILDGLLKNIPPQPVLKIADMGSGKGYLTFALYDHLVGTLGLKTEVTGVEYRPDMVKLCNEIATQSGFTSLKFVQGTIESFNPTGTHVVIALHACDTATDDALAKAVKANAELIVVAPCCHKQIRRVMKPQTQNHPLAAALKFGTYEERLAEMATDTLRAALLETQNYTTNLFEFISADHTPKNVMITAIRNAKPLTPSALAHQQATITALKLHFGIPTHHLETLLPKDM